MNREIFIEHFIGEETAYNLAKFFEAKLENSYGEYVLTFNNKYGLGNIKVCLFENGMSVMSFDLKLLTDMSLNILFKDPVPIDFLFLTSGNMSFKTDEFKDILIESYQNVIIRYKANAPATFTMKAGELVKLNIIQICPEFYKEKNGHNMELLQNDIKNLFLTHDTNNIYHHFGNFNLKIADYIRQLNYCSYNGMIRKLMVKGYVNIILALQLAEHDNFTQNQKLPESLTKEDIAKIHRAAEFIQENIHENLAVSKLAFMVQLTPRKLQLGFKHSHQKSVNNYIKEVKLQAAHEYLLNSNLTISEIVYKIGYNSRSYFTEIFFERFGILPNEFKKNSK